MLYTYTYKYIYVILYIMLYIIYKLYIFPPRKKKNMIGNENCGVIIYLNNAEIT